jgi:hypothetical protein
MVGQGAIRLDALSFGNFEFVPQTDGSDAKKVIIAFDAAFDFRFQIVCCSDSTRFQRAGKCAGQSTGERRNDVIDGGGERCGVLNAVILRVTSMHSEMKGIRESLDIGVPKRPVFLNQTDFSSMDKLTHKYLPERDACDREKLQGGSTSNYLSY